MREGMKFELVSFGAELFSCVRRADENHLTGGQKCQKDVIVQPDTHTC